MFLVETFTMLAWTVGIGYFWLGARLDEIADSGLDVSHLPQWIQDEWGSKMKEVAKERRPTRLIKSWRFILLALYGVALVAALINSGERLLFRLILDLVNLLIFYKWITYLEKLGTKA